MPKKRREKAKKKPAKAPKKAKKKAKKKKAKKKKVKTRKKATKKVVKGSLSDPGRGLYIKKLEIMNAVPIMPCSVLGRDRYGLRFAHTRAENVFQEYARLCRQKNLTIRMIECKMETLPFPFALPVDANEQKELLKNVNLTELWPWTRATCTFEIEDVATSQTEIFKGASLGNNDVWSDISAQTNAFKQALLLYFFTAWPQPCDHLKIIRESLEQITPAEKVEAFKQILPKEAWNVMTNAGAIKALLAFYGGKTK